MKTIRNVMTLSGLCLVLFALGVTGAKAQSFSTTLFSGTFTLPVEAQWGRMTLPAGDYSLHYGSPFRGGIYAVAVTNNATGISHGMVLPRGRGDASAAKSALICLREGDVLYVHSLEMPAIGEAVNFKIPHGVEVQSKVIAKHHNKSGKSQLAQVTIRVERVPVN